MGESGNRRWTPMNADKTSPLHQSYDLTYIFILQLVEFPLAGRLMVAPDRRSSVSICGSTLPQRLQIHLKCSREARAVGGGRGPGWRRRGGYRRPAPVAGSPWPAAQ